MELSKSASPKQRTDGGSLMIFLTQYLRYRYKIGIKRSQSNVLGKLPIPVVDVENIVL